MRRSAISWSKRRTGEQVEAVLRKAAAFPPHLLARLPQLTKR